MLWTAPVSSRSRLLISGCDPSWVTTDRSNRCPLVPPSSTRHRSASPSRSPPSRPTDPRPSRPVPTRPATVSRWSRRTCWSNARYYVLSIIMKSYATALEPPRDGSPGSGLVADASLRVSSLRAYGRRRRGGVCRRGLPGWDRNLSVLIVFPASSPTRSGDPAVPHTKPVRVRGRLPPREPSTPAVESDTVRPATLGIKSEKHRPTFICDRAAPRAMPERGRIDRRVGGET